MSDPQIEPRGVTPGGLPYPEDTEAVMLGAQAIKNLAQAVDNQPPWPWVNMIRWTAISQGGGGSDVLLSLWDLQETNLPSMLEPNIAGQGGFIAPRAGLYAVELLLCWTGSWPGSGQLLMNVSAATSAVPPRSIYHQRSEPNGGTNRRAYSLSGWLRMAAGETCRAYANNGSGAQISHSSGSSPGDKFATRFSARWIAP